MPQIEGDLTNFFRNIKPLPNVRMAEILSTNNADYKKRIQEDLKSRIFFMDFTNVLTETGVVTEQSFLKEFFFRINRQVFPPIYPDKEFRGYLQKMNKASDFSNTILNLDTSILADFLDWAIIADDLTKNKLKGKISEPIRLLTNRLTFHCTSRQVISRLQQKQEARSQFILLNESTEKFLKSPNLESFQQFDQRLQDCLSACQQIRENRKTNGISLELTYRLLVIRDLVDRIRDLSSLLIESHGERLSLKVARLIKRVLRLEMESHNVSTLFFRYVELVFYEITEHTGKKGEAYIQEHKSGRQKMLIKGAIGGALVGLFAIFKPIFHEFQTAPLIEALGYSLIYSAIFLGIYFLKGVLATKQPAMTASTLAKELDKSAPSKRFLWQMSEMVRATFQTQFAAIAGNVALAFPVAAVVYFLLQVSGLYSFPQTSAEYLLQSLHPIESLTLLYAAITGVCLTASGIIAGAVRNWFVFNQISKRLEVNLKDSKHLTAQGVQRLARFIDTHLEALAGNISLGFLLGFLSSAGDVLGLPIDIRHVTFASAQMGMGFLHMESEFSVRIFIILMGSTALVGLINLSVSFSLTLWVVFRSRRISMEQGFELLGLSLHRFLRNPRSFLF